MTLIIYVVDSIMGKGKSCAAINHINNSGKNERFLYITPYLDEVQRILTNCAGKEFVEPMDKGSKSIDIKRLLKQGKNIVSTHALFMMFDEETVSYIESNGYTLIMDEVADVIDAIDISPFDMKTILRDYAFPEKNGVLRWHASEYRGDFQKYKDICDAGCIGVYGTEAFVKLFPVNTFKVFTDVYILTYMFNAQVQKCYYDYHGVKYTYLDVAGDNVDNYRFTAEKTKNPWDDYFKLVNIVDHDKLNSIGDLSTALSFSWYKRNAKSDVILPQLKKNCYNFFRNIAGTKADYNLWTTFKDYEPLVRGKGYATGFLSCNIRATNEYRDRTSVAYLVNKYLNPYVKNFLIERGVTPDEDAYALSEMLQFIWRSAIRNQKQINLYVPSSRMRELLIRWLEENK